MKTRQFVHHCGFGITIQVSYDITVCEGLATGYTNIRVIGFDVELNTFVVDVSTKDYRRLEELVENDFRFYRTKFYKKVDV